MSISVQNISKSYKELNAVDAVSFEVNSGELFGLIGPDGAGKTTIFRILTTLLIADEGQATVVDFDVIKDFKAIRNSVGYMPGKFSLYQDLTVEENLTFFATIFGTTIKENYDLIEDIYVQIEPFKNRRAGALSGGMKQKYLELLDAAKTGIICQIVDLKHFKNALEGKPAGTVINWQQ